MFDRSSVESDVGGGADAAPPWLRLHAEMKSATRRRCAWDAEHARHLREAEALQLWTHFGHVSILEYLEREHGIEPRTALDRLRVSNALADLPLIEADLEDGTLSYSHVKELTRVATPETEVAWREAAHGKTCGEVQAIVAGHKKGDDPDDPVDPELRLRRLTIEVTPQLMVMYRELRATIEEELGHRVDEVEAFRMMLERAKGGAEGASTPAQISVCEHCGRGWQEGPGGRAEIEPAVLDAERCQAELMGAVVGESGRKVRTLTERKRARIIARDRHRCAVPGCRSKRNLDVHHIQHQEDGGGHEDANLVTLCSGHHRCHHRGLLAIEGRAPGAVTFTWAKAPEACARVGANVSQSSSDVAVLRTQARDALVGLGWTRGIAGSAVDEALAGSAPPPSIDMLIRDALRRCPKPAG